MFTYALQRGLELKLLDTTAYAPVLAKGYQGIIGNATVNDEGLVDITSACNGVCVPENYAKYINCTQTVNAKEAVGGFLWATTLIEKRSASKKPPTGNLVAYVPCGPS